MRNHCIVELHHCVCTHGPEGPDLSVWARERPAKESLRTARALTASVCLHGNGAQGIALLRLSTSKGSVSVGVAPRASGSRLERLTSKSWNSYPAKHRTVGFYFAAEDRHGATSHSFTSEVQFMIQAPVVCFR